MSQKYADIIIDISHEGVDRPFQYKIPIDLMGKVDIGTVVDVPFGKSNKLKTGYVIGVSDKPNWDPDKIKPIAAVPERRLAVEGSLIRLAAWMKETYNSTMIAALKTVMPVKEKVRERRAGVDTSALVPDFRPIESLNDEQRQASQCFKENYAAGHNYTYLLHGITGSGKTEVYIDIAESVIADGKDVIVLVPEIALTYQTVARFRSHFGDRIAILNSQLSKGEKYREFEKARDGGYHIIIGPRSALFTPFPNLGLIIIDEEHDTSYKSEKTPKYHAVAVAQQRARIEGASVILGSATPRVSTYSRVLSGEYKLLTLTDRAMGAKPAEVEVVDLRDELKTGNRSVLSRKLYTYLSEAFSRGEQAMLFINRRGYNSCVSCRSCGEVIKCPNCDVSLSLHGKQKLMCHYCGYEQWLPDGCPTCGSKMIGGFGVGTEKLEEEVKKIFPDIRTLRMDRDTTQTKGAHGRIIEAFRNHEADCLIGTQMIVKGHDFGKVTVVGNILADLSLFDTDYQSAERTYDLLTQAAGRAGRTAERPGHVIIQTYQPEHYAIASAAKQDYKSFYDMEMSYRKLLRFPPVYNMLGILITSASEEVADTMAARVAGEIRKLDMDITGPAEAVIGRINNIYRRVIYVRDEDYDRLRDAAASADRVFRESPDVGDAEIQYDFNPMNII